MKPINVNQAAVIQALGEKVAQQAIEIAQLTAAVIELQRAAAPEPDTE